MFMDVKWIEFFKQLGFTTAGPIFLLIIIGFFGKKMMEYFFSETIELKKSELDKEIEVFKVALSSQTQVYKLELDKNLETYKNTLQQISHEHQIKFSKLHSDRAEIMKELFAKLVKMEKSMSSLMSPFQAAGELSKEEKTKIASDDALDFLYYFKANEILFNKQTCSTLNNLNESFQSAWRDFHMYKPEEPFQNLEVREKQFLKSVEAYYQTLNKEVLGLKKQLKDDFRKILGVD
jgi:hypothetical protein